VVVISGGRFCCKSNWVSVLIEAKGFENCGGGAAGRGLGRGVTAGFVQIL